MRPIWLILRRRAGLMLSATVVITGALAAPALAMSAKLGGSGSTSATTSTEVVWSVGVLVAIALLTGAFMIRDVLRDRSISILDRGSRRMRGLQSRTQH